jgi:hypothetical protein
MRHPRPTKSIKSPGNFRSDHKAIQSTKNQEMNNIKGDHSKSQNKLNIYTKQPLFTQQEKK